MLLLKKREVALNIKTINTTQEQYSLGDTIWINSYENIQLSKIDINYSLWGKLRRFVFQPPALYAKIGLESGAEVESKAIITNLSSGVILNHYIASVDDFGNYVSSKSSTHKKIKYVVLFSKHSLGGFKAEVSIKNSFLSILD
ncbi:MAG: hypothetical protein AB8B61_00110 [Cyclobacteriaceae bacterium]